jgi:hypothetical protein
MYRSRTSQIISTVFYYARRFPCRGSFPSFPTNHNQNNRAYQ